MPASARETELREQSKKLLGERYTLGDATRKYTTDVSPSKRGERWEVIRLELFLRLPYMPVNKLIADVTPADMSAFRDERLKEVAPASFLRELNILSHVFEIAIKEWGWMRDNPTKSIRKPSKPPHRDVTITRPQIKAMLKQMGYKPSGAVKTVSQSVAMSFLLALRTGMRAKELCNLEWSDVKDSYCVLRETKTVPRDVPLTPKASAVIERMRGFDTLYVFGLKPQTLSTFFKKYRERAGLSGFTFHDSRHTAATWIAAKMKSNNLPAQQAVFDM